MFPKIFFFSNKRKNTCTLRIVCFVKRILVFGIRSLIKRIFTFRCKLSLLKVVEPLLISFSILIEGDHFPDEQQNDADQKYSKNNRRYDSKNDHRLWTLFFGNGMDRLEVCADVQFVDERVLTVVFVNHNTLSTFNVLVVHRIHYDGDVVQMVDSIDFHFAVFVAIVRQRTRIKYFASNTSIVFDAFIFTILPNQTDLARLDLKQLNQMTKKKPLLPNIRYRSVQNIFGE